MFACDVDFFSLCRAPNCALSLGWSWQYTIELKTSTHTQRKSFDRAVANLFCYFGIFAQFLSKHGPNALHLICFSLLCFPL